MKDDQNDSLRNWRESATQQLLYTSAIFWSSKIDPKTAQDTLKHVQLLFAAGLYTLALSYISLKNESQIQFSLLKANCLFNLGRYSEVIDLSYQADAKFKQTEAALLVVQGRAYLKSSGYSQARDKFLDALQLDVTCFDALYELTSNEMLTGSNELDLINSLDTSLLSDQAEFLVLLYKTRLKKHQQLDSIQFISDTLENKYRLVNDPDVELTRAEIFMVKGDFQKCLMKTSILVDFDMSNISAVKIHSSCLLKLKKRAELYYFAHKLVETFPDNSTSWFVVGTYYLLIEKYIESRRCFSKSSTIDPMFGQGLLN